MRSEKKSAIEFADPEKLFLKKTTAKYSWIFKKKTVFIDNIVEYQKQSVEKSKKNNTSWMISLLMQPVNFLTLPLYVHFLNSIDATNTVCMWIITKDFSAYNILGNTNDNE